MFVLNDKKEKESLKKRGCYLKPSGHYRCCQEDAFYTDVQKFM